MTSLSSFPVSFLELRFSGLIDGTNAVGLCAGYEGKKWRAKKLANHIFGWLPYVALDQTRQDTLNSANWFERVEAAAAHIYRTKKTKSRGEIGEILLHIACVQEFGCLPVLCKLLLKTSHNDTVKGFDSVHIVPKEEDFEIWLGESKFYKDPKRAIAEAIKSVREHLLPAFLDTEKAMIYGHIPDHLPHAAEVKKLFRSSTSSDELLQKAVFPILIAYESKAVAEHTELVQAYKDELAVEIEALHQLLVHSGKDIAVRFQLMFVPMHLKADIVTSFDQKLGAFA